MKKEMELNIIEEILSETLNETLSDMSLVVIDILKFKLNLKNNNLFDLREKVFNKYGKDKEIEYEFTKCHDFRDLFELIKLIKEYLEINNIDIKGDKKNVKG